MEPMLLGSPVSPVSAGSGLTSSAATPAVTPFLPSYLLGDTHHSMTSSSRVSLPGSSPGGGRHFPAAGQTSPAAPHGAKEGVPPAYTTPRYGRLGGDRPVGPPVQCLSPALTPTLPSMVHSPFPDLHRHHPRTPLGSPHTPLRALHTPHGASFLASRDHTLNSSIISSEVHGEVSTTAGLVDDWVTVFGFPVASASYILTQFAQLGTIADQRLPGSGNWMHLKYQTSLQARKALALNGKIFGSNIMIGVMACSDKAVIAADANKENQRSMANTSFMSPGAFNTSGIHATGDTSFSTPKANIRSLTQTYQTTPAENQVVAAANTPKKNDSFISKAMQHLLGV